jgi:hypothetical protein
MEPEFIIMSTKHHHILSQMTLIHSFKSYIYKNHLIVSYHPCLGLASGFYHPSFSPNSGMHFSPSMNATCSAHLILPDLNNLTMQVKSANHEAPHDVMHNHTVLNTRTIMNER